MGSERRRFTGSALAALAFLAAGVPAARADTNLGSFEGTTYIRDVVGSATGSASVTANCPAGTKIVSGGGQGSGGPTTNRVNSMFPVDGSDANGLPDDGFRARAWTTGVSLNATTFAICQAGAAPSYSSGTDSVPADGSAERRAMCPGGTHVSGGGGAVEGSTKAAFLNSSHPVDDDDVNSDPDDGWKVRVHNLRDSRRGFTVHAICRPATPVYRAVVSSVDAGFAAGQISACQDPFADGATLGGGVQFTGEVSEALFSQSTPFDSDDALSTPDDTWSTTVRNTGSTKTMTRYVICEP